jgi:translation initiation factor 3 subunit M
LRRTPYRLLARQDAPEKSPAGKAAEYIIPSFKNIDNFVRVGSLAIWTRRSCSLLLPGSSRTRRGEPHLAF